MRSEGSPEKGEQRTAGLVTTFTTATDTELHREQPFTETDTFTHTTMQHNLVLRSRAIRVAIQAIRCPHTHARTLATFGPRATPDPSHPTTDQTGLKGLRANKGPDRNALYIGGGLAAIGAIWYYYAMVENAYIDKELEGLEARKAGIEGGRGGSVEDATRSAKGRAQEALRSGDAKYQDIKAEAQSKVQAARDQVDQGVERGKERFEEVKGEAAHRASETYSIAGKML